MFSYFPIIRNPNVTPAGFKQQNSFTFSIKHLPFRQRVGGSIPPGLTIQTGIPVFILLRYRDF